MHDPHWFESWFASPYYRVLYENRDELEAEEFVGNLLRYLQPMPGSRMVDIACGEGRFAIELAQKGYDVTGIDLSHRSIERAKPFENDRLHFMVHDMRMPFYVNYFDYAFNFFTSFGYFDSPRDNQLAAKSFAKGLKDGGILVIDYLNSEKVKRNLVAEETAQRDHMLFHIQRRVEDGYFIKDIRFDDAEGRERHYTERVAAFGLSQFITMFRNAGMNLVATFGNYRLDPFDPLASNRLIMVFKK